MPKIDIAALIRDETGAEVIGPGSTPNTVRVKAQRPLQGSVTNPEAQLPQEIEVDVHRLVKDMGEDPSQFEFQMGTPEAPIGDSPLGFLDRWNYEVSRTKPDKAKFLAEKFGAENVQFEPSAGQFRVKKENGWYNADETGLTGFLGKEGDVTAGAIVGGEVGLKLGAAAGTAVAPGVGTVIGGGLGSIAGAGVGAVVSRFISLEDAKKSGLRTEQDAEEVKAELADEFMRAATGQAIGLGIAGAIKTPALVKSQFQKLSQKATTPGARGALAEYLEQATNVPKADNITWMEFPEQVANYQKKIIDYENIPLAERGAHPVKQELITDLQGAVEKLKDHTYDDFVNSMNPVKEITEHVEVNMTPFLEDFVSQYKAAGLIDDAGNWIPEGEQTIASVVSRPAANRLKQTYHLIKRGIQAGKETAATKPAAGLIDNTNLPLFKEAAGHSPKSKAAGGQVLVPFNDVQQMVRNLDELLEASGHYGSQDITTPAKAKIVGMRKGLRDASLKSLAEANPKAADLFVATNQRFSKRREYLDEIIGESSDWKVDATIKKLGKDDNDRARLAMKEIFEGAGVDADSFTTKLFSYRAAESSKKIFKASGTTATVGGVMRLTSPRNTTPIVANQFNKLHKMANAVEFVRNLSEPAKKRFLSSPEALRAFNQVLMQSYQTENTVPEQLVGGALQSTEPVK